MTHLETRSLHGNDSGFLGGSQRLGVDSERFGGAHHCREAAGIVGGGNDEQLLGVFGQSVHAVEEQPLDVPGQGQRLGDRILARELLGGERGMELDQEERIPPRLLDEELLYRLIDLAFSCSGEQRRRRLRVEPVQLEIREAPRVEVRFVDLTCCEEHDDALCLQSTGNEEQCVARRAVEPLHIVDQAEELVLALPAPTAA